jgi:metallo-beta-lactamase family protein
MPEGRPIEKKAGENQRKTSPVFTRMVAAAERLLKIANSIEGRPNKELAGYADAIARLADKMEK